MSFLVAIIALGYALYLGGRIGKLEDKLKNTSETLPLRNQGQDVQSSQVSAEGVVQVIDSVVLGEQTTYSGIQNQTPQINQNEDYAGTFLSWLKEDFMMKAGALLLLIGFGWFVSYAFESGWIGPLGQVASGLIVGAAIMTLGTWRIRTYIHQGGIFTALGATIILLTVFAARGVYDFFTPSTALALMFLTTVFVAFVSVRYRSFNLALGGLILAGAAPLLTVSPNPDVFGLFSYLLVVVIGMLWVVYITGWRQLPLAALIIVALFGLPFMGSWSGVNQDIALLFAFVFTAIFFVTNIMSLVHQVDGSALRAHLATAIGTSLYLIAWIASSVAPEWQSLLFVVWMLVFSGGAFLVYQKTSYRSPFYIYGGTSIALLAAATASELSGAILTIAFTVEIGVIIAVSSFLADATVTRRLSWLFLGPMLLSIGSIASRSWRDSVLHDDFFVLLVLALVLGIAGMYVLEKRRASEDEEATGTALILISASVGYALTLIWLVTHAVWATDIATMMSLIIYTVLGLATYVPGQVQGNKVLRNFGVVLLGMVIARLFLVDVWDMALGLRIVTFFVIGIFLISTAFIARHKKPMVEEFDQNNQNVV